MSRPRWLGGTLWYSRVSIRRRLRSDWPIYASIAAGSALVFGVVCLRAVSAQQMDARFLIADGGAGVAYAAALMLVMGLLVSFVHTQLLMQRIVRDRFVELGTFVNFGAPRAVVAMMIALEQSAFALAGSFAGIVIASGVVAAVAVSGGYAAPTRSDFAAALVLAVLSPWAAVVPVTALLGFRLLRGRLGVARVR